MKRRVLSTDNYANDGIVRIIGVVMTICGAAALIAGSTSAMAESGIASIIRYLEMLRPPFTVARNTFGSKRTAVIDPHSDAAREIIAKRIVAVARNGERDPARLHEQAFPPSQPTLRSRTQRDHREPGSPDPGFLFVLGRIPARRLQDAGPGTVRIIWGTPRSG